MNRIEFMTELAAYLQDVPVIERQEAMKYYNDYFDDAGEEKEEAVIEELGSPEKVADTIKADLGIHSGENAQNKTADPGRAGNRTETDEMYASMIRQANEEDRTRNKVILILAVIFIGIPILLPLALGGLAVIFGIAMAAVAVVIAIVCGFIACLIGGLIFAGVGIATVVAEPAVGLALAGMGLILAVIGLIGIVAGVKLCIVVVPRLFNGTVHICKKLFGRWCHK